MDVDGREVSLTCIHRGVDLPPIMDICKEPSFHYQVGQWRQRFADKTLVTGIVDSLEHLKGLSIKFLEIEHLLTENPHYVSKVVFLVIGVPPLNEYNQYFHYSNLEARGCVQRINAMFGAEVCIYEERTVEQNQLRDRLSLFAATDILLITAVP
jgi:trehalose-6-phosphate synthase